MTIESNAITEAPSAKTESSAFHLTSLFPINEKSAAITAAHALGREAPLSSDLGFPKASGLLPDIDDAGKSVANSRDQHTPPEAYSPNRGSDKEFEPAMKALSESEAEPIPAPTLEEQIKEDFGEAAGQMDPRHGTDLLPRPGARWVRDYD